MVVLNRCGLPRRWLAQMKKHLGRCEGANDNIDEDDAGDDAGDDAAHAPKRRKKGGCTHGPDAEDCNKFCFTCVHKGEWELAAWQDSKLIVGLSDFFSGSRAGLLARGSHKSKYSYQVWAPEGIWYYNIEGRSPSDGNDQERKKLCIAETSATQEEPDAVGGAAFGLLPCRDEGVETTDKFGHGDDPAALRLMQQRPGSVLASAVLLRHPSLLFRQLR